MARASEPRMNSRVVAGASGSRAQSWVTLVGADVALLTSALFLQRFTLSFGHSLMSLDVVPVAVLLIHQFASGRLLIQYDRLLWFLAAGLAVTCSMLINFKSTMLPSYCLLMITYFFFTLVRPSTADRYNHVLRAFQFLIALLSFLAIAQFIAQFWVDGRELIRFYGIFPEFLFTDQFNTIIPVTLGSSLIKSNGLFLAEPSTLSQIVALSILIEVFLFRRSRYLVLLTLGLLMSYSGTELVILLLFLPLTCIGRNRAGLPVLLLSVIAVALFATGTIDLSAFTSRVGEFENTEASGFERFISSFWMASEHFDTATLAVLLHGSGPGTMDGFVPHAFYAAFGGTWFKLLYEYGLIGSLVFLCFLASCFRGSWCPGIVRAAILVAYVFLGELFLTTPFLVIMIVLCTLSGPERRPDLAEIPIRPLPAPNSRVGSA